MKNLSKILIGILLFGVLLSGAIIYAVKFSPCAKRDSLEKFLSPQEAGQKAIDFINRNMPEGEKATLINVGEESGIYKLRFKMREQEYIFYLTKDGKILFPGEGIKIEENLIPPAPSPPPSLPKFPLEKLESLAKCLKEKGVKFYGTYRCGWCVRQKEIFGEAQRYLPYIECSPDRATEEELRKCEEAKVSSVPDWRFPDGKQELGMLSPEKLAELSGCQF